MVLLRTAQENRLIELSQIKKLGRFKTLAGVFDHTWKND